MRTRKEENYMKKQKSKKNGIIAAVITLSSVSLVSVGFASWIMSGGDSTTVDGQISVETVDDNRFLIAKTGDYAPKIAYGDNLGHDVKGNDASKITFGIDDSTPIANAWLTAGGTGENAPKYENLKATLSFYVANLKTSQTTVPSAVLSVVDNGTSGWATAAGNTKNYVVAPTNLTCSISESETQTIDNLVYRKVTAPIQFGWGSYFGNENPKNPYTYFNSMTYSVENANTAKTVLHELETYLAGVNFRVTVTTTVPNA